MQQIILYMKMEENIELYKDDVLIKDLCKLTCKDIHIAARVKAMKVHEFRKDDRQVVSFLKLVELIEKQVPNVQIVNVGSTTETVLERVQEKKWNKLLEGGKILLVSLICFFGTAFTVMAFHNDIGINEMFENIYYMVSGQKSSGFTVLEAGYSIGLGSGIVLFFNHIGKRRITRDPTPVEVEMCKYETDVNTTLAGVANKEGKTIDVS